MGHSNRSWLWLCLRAIAKSRLQWFCLLYCCQLQTNSQHCGTKFATCAKAHQGCLIIHDTLSEKFLFRAFIDRLIDLIFPCLFVLHQLCLRGCCRSGDTITCFFMCSPTTVLRQIGRIAIYSKCIDYTLSDLL